MISTLSLFECITQSSPLPMEEIKLFAIVNWIFHLSIIFRLFMILFKYGYILSRYSSTDNTFCYNCYFVSSIIVIPKISYSCWFIITLLFSMLTEILNISEHSIFNCFSFFFYSKKILYILYMLQCNLVIF